MHIFFQTDKLADIVLLFYSLINVVKLTCPDVIQPSSGLLNKHNIILFTLFDGVIAMYAHQRA